MNYPWGHSNIVKEHVWTCWVHLTTGFGVAGFDLVLLSFTLPPTVLGWRAGAGASAYGATATTALITAGPGTPARPTSIHYSTNTNVSISTDMNTTLVFLHVLFYCIHTNHYYILSGCAQMGCSSLIIQSYFGHHFFFSGYDNNVLAKVFTAIDLMDSILLQTGTETKHQGCEKLQLSFHLFLKQWLQVSNGLFFQSFRQWGLITNQKNWSTVTEPQVHHVITLCSLH